jgi:hypothetical protein
MADYTYSPQAAVDIATALLITQAGASGMLYGSEADAQGETDPLTVTVAGGVVTTTISVSSFGQLPEFTVADYYQVWWRSGNAIGHLMSFDGVVAAVESNAGSAATSAAAAATSAAAAQALDSTRMALAGAAVASGGTFWGVWSVGNAPTPPNDGRIHWGFEII